MTDQIPSAAVEAAAEALWNEREYRDPSGDEPEGWCPPGHDVHQPPPHEPFLWEQMVAEGKYEGDQRDCRADARAVLAAALPTLTDAIRGPVEAEREEWRGKAEHRLNEWKLRDGDVQEATITADEAVAAREMWRSRAEKAEAELLSMRRELAPQTRPEKEAALATLSEDGDDPCERCGGSGQEQDSGNTRKPDLSQEPALDYETLPKFTTREADCTQPVDEVTSTEEETADLCTWQCEIHPGVIWPHGDCPGPGMPLASSPEKAPWLEGEK